MLCRILAAVYQLPDGLYGVTSGVLRGLGMQPRLLWVNLGGFWGIGILLGILLTFKACVGVIGLWWGLLSGIVSTGDARWRHATRQNDDMLTHASPYLAPSQQIAIVRQGLALGAPATDMPYPLMTSPLTSAVTEGFCQGGC